MNKNKKWHDWLQLLIGLIIVALVNIIASQFFYRIDLTEDKRYTITPATKKLLGQLQDVVYVEVYLSGDMPAGFERLQRSIQENLEEFRVYANNNIQYKFIDPSAATDPTARTRMYQQLVQRGLQPTNLVAKEGGKNTEKIIFPGAIVTYGDKETPVLLLKGNQASTPAERLNQSVEGVEYELASAIKKITAARRSRIGITGGHGELTNVQAYDMYITLRENYDIKRIILNDTTNLQNYDAIIVARPDSAFTEAEKYKIDQFIVGGGKALFFIDQLRMSLDSIRPEGSLALPYNINLDDMLFRYGVRINQDLLLDINASYIPMVVGMVGDKPKTQLVPWRFYPLINTFGKHPIVKNMDAVQARFVSSIDTVKADGIRKTPLLLTSRYTKVQPVPATVSFNEAREQPQPEQYNKSHMPVSYLLEGRFQSLYTNRSLPVVGAQSGFKAQDKPSKILVCSDGDLIRNDINKAKNEAFPLGYDRFAGITFANKDFVLNAIQYMLDEEGVIMARTKEIKLRPLDKPRVESERLKWQIINLALPVALVILFGVVRHYIRKRRYERKK